MKRTGAWRAAVLGVTGVLGVGLALAAVPAAPALANDDLAKYKGGNKDATVEPSRSYSEASDQTTFTFVLATNGEPVSHVVLLACEGIPIVSASGPDQPNGTPKPAASTEPKNDPSTNHLGIKFEFENEYGKGAFPGTYTIVFPGNILGAEFVVKDGDGHKHFRFGPESDACKVVPEQTPQTPTENPPTDNPPTDNPPTNNPPTNNPPTNNPPTNNPPANNPSATPASNQPGQPGTEVQSATVTNNPPAVPSTDVLGAQQNQPAALAALPRTGSGLGLLAPLGAMLLAFGSVARAAARRG